MTKVKRTNISLSSDTLERLDQYAIQNHTTRSQAITMLVWEAKVKNPQARGQMSVEDIAEDSNKRKRDARSR
ncbi:MAG: ribbon-helix-helix protein, CopG family [Clostridia bacterium]|nr:ribbon-helix-helix protein, CopG family [Clostridia bacterium]